MGGLRTDYLSPTLYLLDVVWLGWWVSKFKVQSSKFKFEKLWWVGLVVINVVVASNKWVAIYRWLRWWQWWETIKFIKLEKSKVKGYLRWIIPIWIGLESLLGLAQVYRGASLQGIFYWLGERRFWLGTPGIALMSWGGREVLRAYGTFSHPNSLAGFLLVAGMLINNEKLRINNKLVEWVVRWLWVVGIVLTGSRTGWLVLVVVGLWCLKKRAGWLAVGLVGILVGGAMLWVNQNYGLRDYFGGWDRESGSKRWNLSLTAGAMFGDNPLLGVGMGNFVVRLPDYQTGRRSYQPVHNIFLLWMVETGIVGLILGLGYLGRSGRLRKLGIVGLIILVTGMVDHYWLTLPQNMWLLAVVVGLW